jgi:hypothetical protein
MSSALYFACASEGWYTAALQTSLSNGRPALNLLKSSTKARTDRKEHKSHFITVNSFGSNPSSSATMFILSTSRTAQITCHPPSRMSWVVTCFPRPLDVPVITHSFLSPNFLPSTYSVSEFSLGSFHYGKITSGIKRVKQARRCASLTPDMNLNG